MISFAFRKLICTFVRHLENVYLPKVIRVNTVTSKEGVCALLSSEILSRILGIDFPTFPSDVRPSLVDGNVNSNVLQV